MRSVILFLLMCLLSATSIAQKTGSKVSLVAVDGKTYTGTITEVQGEIYKIKYDSFDFTSWLLKTQFTVTQEKSELPETELPPTPVLPQTQPVPIPDQQEPQPVNAPPVEPVVQKTAGNSTAMTRSDSLKMAITDIKKAFNAASKLFIGKSDTLSIVIPDIDYENLSLARLKSSLEKIKGARSVVMHYANSTANLEVAFKGKPADLWDSVPSDIRMMFKLIEAGDRIITLKFK